MSNIRARLVQEICTRSDDLELMKGESSKKEETFIPVDRRVVTGTGVLCWPLI